MAGRTLRNKKCQFLWRANYSPCEAQEFSPTGPLSVALLNLCQFPHPNRQEEPPPSLPYRKAFPPAERLTETRNDTMSLPESKNDNASDLSAEVGPQTFHVYCQQRLAEAVETIEQLSRFNERLSFIREQSLEIKVVLRGKTLFTCNILDDQNRGEFRYPFFKRGIPFSSIPKILLSSPEHCSRKFKSSFPYGS